MRLWQYKEQVGPASTKFGETIMPDKWEPQIPDRQLPPAPRAAALLLAAACFVPLLAPAERAQLDKFAPQLPPISNPRPIPAREGIFVVDGKQLTLKESVSIDRWQPPLERAPLRLEQTKTGWQVVDTLALTSKEAVSIDRWHPPIERPYPARPLPAREGLLVIDVKQLTIRELVSADRWVYPIEQPYPYRLRLRTAPDCEFNTQIPVPIYVSAQSTEPISIQMWQAQGRFMPVRFDAELVSADRWHYPVEQPYPYRRRPAAEGIFTIDAAAQTLPERATPDKWAYPIVQPYLTLRYPVREGWQVRDGVPRAEAVSFDRWNFNQATPRFDIVRPRYFAPTSVSDQLFNIPAVPETIRVDKWKGQAPDLFLALRYPVREGLNVIDALQLTKHETTFADKWVQPIQQPYLVLRYPVREGLSVRDLRQPIYSPDAWAYPIVQPYPSRPLPAREGWSAIDGLPRAETPAIDKWRGQFPDQIAGILRGREPGIFVIDARQLTLGGGVSMAGWYRLTEQPYPYRPRPAAESLFIIDAKAETQPELVSADRWFLLVAQPYLRLTPRGYVQEFFYTSLVIPVQPLQPPLFAVLADNGITTATLTTAYS